MLYGKTRRSPARPAGSSARDRPHRGKYRSRSRGGSGATVLREISRHRRRYCFVGVDQIERTGDDRQRVHQAAKQDHVTRQAAKRARTWPVCRIVDHDDRRIRAAVRRPACASRRSADRLADPASRHERCSGPAPRSRNSARPAAVRLMSFRSRTTASANAASTRSTRSRPLRPMPTPGSGGLARIADGRAHAVISFSAQRIEVETEAAATERPSDADRRQHGVLAPRSTLAAVRGRRWLAWSPGSALAASAMSLMVTDAALSAAPPCCSGTIGPSSQVPPAFHHDGAVTDLQRDLLRRLEDDRVGAQAQHAFDDGRAVALQMDLGLVP